MTYSRFIQHAGITLAVAATVGFLLARSGGAQPQQLPPAEDAVAGVQVALRAHTYGEQPDGSRGGIHSSALTLARSEFRSIHLSADPESCAQSMPSAARKGSITWTIEAALVSLESDRSIVDVGWWRHDAAGRHADVVEGRRRVIIGAGESYPLDLIDVARVSKNTCSRVTLTLDVQRLYPAQVANAVLRYDLWLLHRDRTGRTVTDRLQFTARHDTSDSFFFGPMHYGTDGRPSASSPDAVRLDISGTIKSRVRTDGRLEVLLETARNNRWQQHVTGDTGRKYLLVAPDETLDIVLPPWTGSLGTVDLGALFRGDHTALRLTVSRIL